MPLIYLIRHGEAAASWDQDADPGLSVLGLQQARQVADEMVSRLSKPLPVLSSPMRRCRETAEPLAALWKTDIRIEPRVIEVPSPVKDLKQRHVWLRRILQLDWPSVEETAPDLVGWRVRMLDALRDLQQDTIVFTHFIAINAVVSHARNDARVANFMPDNCSVTVLAMEEGRLRVVEMGREMETRVN